MPGFSRPPHSIRSVLDRVAEHRRIRSLAGSSLRACTRALEGLDSGLGDALRTTRYLAGRLEFQARADDIWIATYPRSGTTWLQYLTFLLIHGRERPFDHIHDVTPWFERSLASGQHSAKSLASLPSPRIFKSHLPHDWLPGMGRKIHMVRKVEQVVESYFRLYTDYLEYTGTLDDFVDDFVAGNLQYESWFDHEAQWQHASASPSVLLLEYETCLRDPKECARRVAGFCGAEPSDAELDAIVQASSKSAMKAEERRFDHAELLLIERGVRRGHFIAADATDQGASRVESKLSAEHRDRLQQAAGKTGQEHMSASFGLFGLHKHLR